MLQVVVQQGAKGIEGGGHAVVHVAFAFGGFAEDCQILLEIAVVVESRRVDEGFELRDHGAVGQYGVDRRSGRVGGIVCEVKGPPVGQYIVEQAVGGLLLYGDVGGDAATVAYGSSCGGAVCRGEAVGGAFGAAVVVAFAVVESLDEASRRNVVAGGGEFHDVAVGQGARALHKAFAVGARANDHTAVEILHCAGEDF